MQIFPNLAAVNRVASINLIDAGPRGEVGQAIHGDFERSSVLNSQRYTVRVESARERENVERNGSYLSACNRLWRAHFARGCL